MGAGMAQCRRRSPPFPFDSRTRRHMWIEFVVAPRGFSPGTPVVPSPQPTSVNFNSITFLNEFL